MLGLQTISIQTAPAYFGDKRIWKRFLSIKEAISKRMSSLVTVCFPNETDRAGAYRFLSNQKVTPEAIILTQQPVLQKRIANCINDVLMIQDSSTLSYPTHPRTINLGKIGCNKTPGRGIITHNSIGLDAEQNVCLGLIKQSYFYHDDKPKNWDRAIEDKESYRWIEHLRYNHSVCPHAIHIADRECDIYEFFLEAQELGAKIIVRQCQDRNIEVTMQGKKDGRISEQIEKAAVSGSYQALVQEEIVDLSIKYTQVMITTPQRSLKQRGDRHYQPLNLCAIQVSGVMSDGQEILWNLLTSLEIKDFHDAKKVVHYYAKRWHIELFHKAMKTGFGLEKARLEDGEKLKNLIALVSIEAALVYAMVYAARQENAVPSERFLELSDLKIISMLMEAKSPPTLQEIVQFIGKQGGFSKTKNYPNPGILTFFRGWNIIRHQIQAVKRCVE